MKRILFIVPHLHIGGVQRSFINLINTIDRTKYAIDVFLLSARGPYMNLLPSDVRLITSDETDMVTDYFPSAIYRLLRTGHFRLAIKRVWQFLVSRIDRGYGGYLMSRMYPAITDHYDVAIDEGGQSLLYYMVDKINANRKLSFFHNDYAQWDFYFSYDKKYYPKVDYILTISDICCQSLISYFPNITKERFIVMENISAPDFIQRMANVPIYDMSKHGVTLATIGRLCEQKGIDIAIEAAQILKSKNIAFKWYFIGDGQFRKHYEQLVKRYKIEQNVVFLGSKENPYPYIKNADIVVHPSRYEGKSIALDEIKILCKPIVVTNFSTVCDQFTDRTNASICAIDPHDMANHIVELLDHPELQQRYVDYLKKHVYDNTSQINILYKLIDEE